jgi:hypothetical protein
MIKFFERKKLTRKFLQLEKALEQEGTTQKISLLENERKELEKKLTVSPPSLTDSLPDHDFIQYVLYYPKAVKYNSLFAEEDQTTTTPLTKQQLKMLDIAIAARDQALAVFSPLLISRHAL